MEGSPVGAGLPQLCSQKAEAGMKMPSLDGVETRALRGRGRCQLEL